MKKIIIITSKKTLVSLKILCMTISLSIAILIVIFNNNLTKNNVIIPTNNNTSDKYIKDVPILCQMPNLPTGCESASAAMLLNWFKVSVTMEEIAKLLPKGERPYYSSGKLIGGNPEYEFVGDPFSSSGFGTYHQPIHNIVNHYLPDKSLDMTGCSFDELLKTIANNKPVIVWATVNMQPPSITTTWYDKNGNKIMWKSPEHAMVLIGYTNTEVIVNDPLVGKTVHYNRYIFQKNWECMGSQAVTIQ